MFWLNSVVHPIQSESSSVSCIFFQLSNSAKISFCISGVWRALNMETCQHCMKEGVNKKTHKSRAKVGTSLGRLIIPSSMRAWCLEANLLSATPLTSRNSNIKKLITYCSSGVGNGLWCFLFGGHCGWGEPFAFVGDAFDFRRRVF